MSDIISKEQFDKHMKKLTKVPEGFELTITNEKLDLRKDAPDIYTYTYKSDTIEIKFSQLGIGATNFLVEKKGWLTFDRRGVEASFYHLPMGYNLHEGKSLNRIFKEQIQRVEKQLGYYKEALDVPGIPFTVSPERLEALKKELSKGRTIHFMPGGFGTGYDISPHPNRTYGVKRASADMETFFGVKPLFISSLDCD